jgi:hypothetical protein
LLNLKHVGFLQQSRLANLIYYATNSNFLLYDELRRMVEKTELSEKRPEDVAVPPYMANVV